MALLINKLFSNRKKTSNKYQESSERCFNFTQDQIRLVLFRECDFRGRKLLFDSCTVQKVPIPPNYNKNLAHNGTTQSNKNEIFVEISNDYGYQYSRPCSDISQLREMIFGSVAMSYRGTSLKIHSFSSPPKLMCTQVFPSPRHTARTRVSVTSQSFDGLQSHSSIQSFEKSAKFDYSTASSTTSFNENTSNRSTESDLKGNTAAESVPLDVPSSTNTSLKFPPSLEGDSGFCGEHSFNSLSSGPPSMSLWETQILGNAHGFSCGSLYKRWLRSASMSLDCNLSDSSLCGAQQNQTSASADECITRSNHRTSKLGLAVIIQLTEGQETEMERFLLEHSALIESMVYRARSGAENAYIKSANFASLMFDVYREISIWITDLISGSPISVYYWHKLKTTCSNKYQNCDINHENRNKLSTFVSSDSCESDITSNIVQSDSSSYSVSSSKTVVSKNVLSILKTKSESNLLSNSYDRTMRQTNLMSSSLLEMDSGLSRRVRLGKSLLSGVKSEEKCGVVSAKGNPIDLSEKFVKELCEILEGVDVKQTNFFVSTLVTAVLTHHLGWVTTVLPPTEEDRETVSRLRSPCNPLWAQLSDLYGAVGHPTKLAHTILCGSNKGDLISKILNILTYFIRCTIVEKNNLQRYSYKEEHAEADNICNKKNMQKAKENFQEPLNNMKRNIEELEMSMLKSTGTCKNLLENSKSLSECNRNSSESKKSFSENNKQILLENGVKLSADGKNLLEHRNYLLENRTNFLEDTNNLSEGRKNVFKDRKNVFEHRKKLSGDRKNLFEDGKCFLEEWKNLPGDRKSLFEDRETFLEDRKNLFEDRKNLFEDRKNLFEDRKKLFEDRQNLFEDRKKLFEDRKNVFEDSKNVLEDGKNLVEDRKHLFEVNRNSSDTCKNQLEIQKPSGLSRTKSYRGDLCSEIGELCSKNEQDELFLDSEFTEVSDSSNVGCEINAKCAEQNRTDQNKVFPVSTCALSQTSSSSCQNTPESKEIANVIFVLGENDSLVGLKSRNIPSTSKEDGFPVRSTKSVNCKKQLFTSECLSDSSDSSETSKVVIAHSTVIYPDNEKISETRHEYTRSQSVPPSDKTDRRKFCTKTVCKHRKSHPGLRLDLKQYPEIVRNYLKHKNIELSHSKLNRSLSTSMYDCSNLEFLSNFCDCDSSSEETLQTPSNASELDCTNINDKFERKVERRSKMKNDAKSNTNGVESKRNLSKTDITEFDHPLKVEKENNAIFQHENIVGSFEECDEKDENDKMVLIELPTPRIISESCSAPSELSKTSVGYTESLLRGVSNRYISDMVLQGTVAPFKHWEHLLRRDLSLSSRRPLLDQPVQESVAIVANIDTWEVHLVSNHISFSVDKDSPGVLVGMSQLVANMLESLLHMWKLKTPAEYCLMYMESKLREFCLMSKTLAQFLLVTEFCNIDTLTNSLQLEVNDIPLLMAIASTHTPKLTSKYGLSFQ